MPKTITHSVQFKGIKPEELYEIYMSSKLHAQAVEAPAKIEARVGGKFSAFGMLKGKFLVLKKGELIVQTWRSVSWKKTDADSILVLTFEKTKAGSQINLAHVHIPDHDYEGVKEGWFKYYWKPWSEFINGCQEGCSCGK